MSRSARTNQNKGGENSVNDRRNALKGTSFFDAENSFFKPVKQIQPKLTVSAPDDVYEKDADAMADRVMRMPDPQIQRQEEEEEELLQMKEQGAVIHRKCKACEEEESIQKKSTEKPKNESPEIRRKCAECEKEEEEHLQRKPLTGNEAPFFQRKETGGGEVNRQTVTALQSSAGSGNILPTESRSWMESRFGTDFGGVRVHTDSRAERLSRNLNAKAFTYGSDIYFNRGEFSPETSEGKRLLAHELTHVVQQNNDRGLVQRRTLREVGATAEGSGLRVDGGPLRRPGQSGYSQLLTGASAELADEMLVRGDLSEMTLNSVMPQLGGLRREQLAYLRIKAEAESHLEFTVGTPPSIVEDLENRRDAAQAQLNALARSRDELLVMTMNFNAFVPQGNSVVHSAARLSVMQSLIGATNNEAMASALIRGLNQALEASTQYQSAFRAGSRAASQTLDPPPADESAQEAMQNVNNASRDLNDAYRGFRITEMQNLIREFTQAGAGDRDRLEEINEHKQMIQNVGTAIDSAMAIVSPGGVANVLNPSTSIPDAVHSQVTGAIPSIGSALSFLGDIAFESEISSINQRLEALDSLMAAEQATINYQRYERRRNAFKGALRTFTDRLEQLQARLRTRRQSYLDMGERLDRFARMRGGAGGVNVERRQEYFTTILTVTAGVRELLSLARWGQSQIREKEITPREVRRWYGQVTASTRPEGEGAQRWRAAGRLTEGERQMIQSILTQVVRFERNVVSMQEVFGAVDERAGEVMGSGRIRAVPDEGTY